MGDSSGSPEAGRSRGCLIPHLLAAVLCLWKQLGEPRNPCTNSSENSKKKKKESEPKSVCFSSF